MVTLEDYRDKVVIEPEKFYDIHKNLLPGEYRSKITEIYGPVSGRDKKMVAMVNAAVLAYVIKKTE